MSKSFRLLAPAAAALALAVPAAQARPDVNLRAGAPSVTTVAPAPAAADGFDWGSAAIGAGGVAGLLALATGGVALAGRARVSSAR